MKKFTIIAAPEYEHMILRELGRARFVQLKEVTGIDFTKIKETSERSEDFTSLYKKFHETYQSLEKTGLLEHVKTDLSMEELRDFTDDPEATVDNILTELTEFKKRLDEARTTDEARRKERERRLAEARERLARVRALQPDELKSGLAVGLVDLKHLPRLVEHLQRFEDISHKVIEISPETGYIFIFGPEQRRGWIETLFLIFEVKDIFEVMSTGDVLLALDTEIREDALKEYEEEAEKLQLLVEREEEADVIKDQVEKIQVLVEREEGQYPRVLSKAKYMDNLLRVVSHRRAPVLRTKVISVIQGWISEENLKGLDQIIDDVQEKTGELFFIEYEDPSHEDHAVPTPTPKFKPSFLQPAWTLTTLRGYPSIHEVNPNYITILVFSFQFGLMFGDIGQGAIFLLLGVILTKKFKSGMASKLGPMFIPMGLFAIFFGFLYDSIFLVEGMLFHHHQILPNPVEHTTQLMLIVFQIAVIEVILGLIIGAINEYKSGHKWGVIGEHGLGMILYVLGLYLSAYAFMVDRNSPVYGDFMAVTSYWAFYVMIVGMVLAMVEPIIAAFTGGHFGIEVFGEGVGALLMTFVEGLANLFSFLRIAAFALAHASLAIAAHAMSHSMGVGGLILMNVIAMSFEFISSSVQSIRLLYYEFMGKFFHGGGAPFRPFSIRNHNKEAANPK